MIFSQKLVTFGKKKWVGTRLANMFGKKLDGNTSCEKCSVKTTWVETRVAKILGKEKLEQEHVLHKYLVNKNTWVGTGLETIFGSKGLLWSA